MNAAGRDICSVENYNRNRGRFSALAVTDSNLFYGLWMPGNNYRNPSPMYGSYPPDYLKRMKLLFPHPRKVLHLFSGMVQHGAWSDETTMDIRAELNPDITGDAEQIEKVVQKGIFDLIFADPPYDQNHTKYGTKPINRRIVVKGCSKILVQGGYLVWLDTIIPIWSKNDGWKLKGTVAMVQSTNHKARIISVLQKQGDGPG